jgi:hypothetical protein
MQSGCYMRAWRAYAVAVNSVLQTLCKPLATDLRPSCPRAACLRLPAPSRVCRSMVEGSTRITSGMSVKQLASRSGKGAGGARRHRGAAHLGFGVCGCYDRAAAHLSMQVTHDRRLSRRTSHSPYMPPP